MKKYYHPSHPEACHEGINRGDSGSNVVAFYDGISNDYSRIFGIHTEAWETDLRTLMTAIGRQRFKRILEIGCGPGILTSRLLKVADYCLAIDVSPKMVEIARRNLACIDPRCVAVEKVDVLSLPPHIRKQKFDAVFFWGNGMTHIPPQHYSRFTSSVCAVLDKGGMLIIDLRDGKEWIKLAGQLDMLSQFAREANFVHIYTPHSPQVGDMFECVIVSVQCSADHRISGRIISPPIRAYFNDKEALLNSLSEKGLRLISDLPSSGLTTARTLTFTW